MTFDDEDRLKTSLLSTGGQYLLTGVDCQPQVAHKDLRTGRRSVPGYFFIEIGKKERKLYVCKNSHNFALYSHSERRKLTDIIKLDIFKPLPFPFFIGHGYMKHGEEYLRHTSQRNHVYLFPNEITLHDCIIFAYDCSISIAAQGKQIMRTKAPKIEGT